jgi:DNA-binding NarL/FixJ family response regulator
MTAPDLLIVDDCRLYREGLSAILARQYAAGAIRTAHDTSSLLRALEDRCPDVILLNLASFDSHALMRAARTHSPQSRMIVVGASEGDEGEIVACAEAGVTGYHLRTDSLPDLVHLIAGVIAGESLCSPRVTALLLRRLAVLAADGHSDRKELVLTQRETQIVHLLELGLSNKEIAAQLCIEVATVKNHVHSLLAKLGVRRRAHAVAVMRGRTTIAEPAR